MRGTRVLSATGVSSPRPDSDDSCDRVRTLLGAKPIAPTSLHASTPDDRACSSEDFGERRANARVDTRTARATTIWFRSGWSLQVVEDARRRNRI